MVIHALQTARSWLPLVAALLLFVGASSGGPATAGSGDPGMIFVSTTTPINGQQGKLLLLRVEPQEGDDHGRSCLLVDAGSYALSSVYVAEGSGIGSSCGDAPDPMIFSPGTYTLIVGVYENTWPVDLGLVQPSEREIQVTVNVNGATQVQISGEALSRLLFGDVNCDGEVDAADALDILRHTGGMPIIAGEGCPKVGE